MDQTEETRRIEELWRGSFGEDYSRRNIDAGEGRGSFWTMLLEELAPRSVLEVGCNVGGNLRWVAEATAPGPVVGMDINADALVELKSRVPAARAVLGAARQLPFADSAFEMVFTVGVLIHQPPESLAVVMSEVVRCSSRLIVCGEYYAEEPTEVRYRGLDRALWKRDFGGDYLEGFSELELVRRGFLSKDDGPWDDVTYWILRKR